MHTEPNNGRTAIVIGGSLAGLFAGNMLRTAGWKVKIYERSPHDLDSRGGGIVLQPDVVEVFRRAGVDLNQIDLGVGSRQRTIWHYDGSIQSRNLAPQTQTSWSLVFGTMKKCFGQEDYLPGKKLVALSHFEDEQQGEAVFEDGSTARGDLLIGADGHGSSVRSLLWPAVEPSYAGYLAWRGLVDEAAVPDAAQELIGNFDFANRRTENGGSHMLGYLVPGENNDTRPGHRLYNWVWYRTADADTLRDIMTDRDGVQRGFSMPEGKLSERWVRQLRREATEFLPPNFRAMVEATRQPFAQAIRDLTVDSMVKGRVVLLGDAAFVPRPHTAASTSKAAFNAYTLADALRRNPGNLSAALQAWEPAQLMLGKQLYLQGTSAGKHLLLHQH